MEAIVKRLLYGVALLLLTPGLVFAQEGTIQGTVTDAETEEPLPGATVQVADLGIGTATNVDGQYELSVPTGTQTLQVSFVGYRTIERDVEVDAGQTITENFSMEPAPAQLSEVVVTAQQVQRQAKSLGYSVSSISSEDLAKTKEVNVVKSLSGKVPGVQVTSQSGNVGGGARIILRGIASLGGDNQPLFVVDGVPVSNSNVSSGSRLVGTYDTGNKAGQLNPNSIASISVLKGAAAAALYGQRAKNGVILIETKKGSDTPQTSVQFSSSVLGSRPTVLPTFQNKYGPGGQGKYDVESLNGWGPLMGGQMVTDFVGNEAPLTAAPDNVSNFYNTGVTAENTVSFANSGDFGDFRLGLTSTNTAGMIPNSELDRLALNLNAGTQALNDKLEVRIGSNYVKEETAGRQAAGGNDPNLLVGIINGIPRNITNSKLENNFETETGDQISLTEFTNNPYWVTNKNVFTTDVERFFGFTKVAYDVFDWLTLQERIGTDIISETRRERNLKGTKGRESGAFRDDIIRQRQIDHDFTIRFNRDLGDNFSLQGILGHNINQETFERTFNDAVNLNVDALFNFTNANSNTPGNFKSIRRIIGAYGDLTLGFRDYAFLEVTGRNDWSSTLPTENRSFFYPSVNASLVFTDLLDQEYDLSIPGLSYGKLRGNYAQVGSDEDPHQLTFDFIPNSSVFGQFGTDVTFPFRGLTAFEVSSTIPPTDLKPQRQKSWEVGAELGFFSGRVNLDFTYYNQKTEDQIISLPIAESSGFNFRRTNVGTVKNEGVEVVLNAGLITRPDFAWRSTVNFSQNDNTVVSLAPGVNELTLQSGFNSLQIRARPGEEIQFFGVGWARDPETGKVIINPDTGLRQSGEDKALGSVYPDFKVGFNNSFSIWNFDFSFLIDWKQGGHVFSSTVQDLRSAGLAEITARNRGGTFVDNKGVIVTERDENGDILETKPNDVPVQSMQAFWDNFSDQSIIENGIFSATYAKLREASLTFNFPQRWMEGSLLRNASLTLEGRNLLLIYSEVPHIDPETNLFGAGANIGQGVEFNNVPNATSFGATLNLTF